MNRTTLREVLVPLVSLVVLVVLGWLAYDLITGDRVRPITPSDSRVSREGRVDLLPDEASAMLPADLPVPSDATDNERFDVATRDGDVQGTRTYESDQDLATERDAYEAYMEAKGWTIVDRQESAGYAAILAERGGRKLIASFTARGDRTAATVTVVQASATN